MLAISLGGTAVWLFRLPPLVLSPENNGDGRTTAIPRHSDTVAEAGDVLMHAAVGNNSGANSLKAETTDPGTHATVVKDTRIRETDISKMMSGHPFYEEAKRVLSGRLEESDSLQRRRILDYCEHFRTAYPTRDIDFLRQLFSDNALIIVGTTVKSDDAGKSKTLCQTKVVYTVRSKQQYLERLQSIFRANEKIDVGFSDFRIMRHPSIKGIYGVSLRQTYTSDRYSDEGYLFLLWDFRNPSMPKIHVRTWQPESSIHMEEERIDISDFNLE
ncbi:MAG: hypothetical protein K2O56_06485 [Muribaculaceae bacterium]|nr:hypothetical protein [Muribaculaceae bacterium]